MLVAQFTGTIETVALLLEKNLEYPPRVKRYEVHYDWVNKKAKVAVTAGEEWDEYIMRYDEVSLQCMCATSAQHALSCCTPGHGTPH